jgi:hypothetical protein
MNYRATNLPAHTDWLDMSRCRKPSPTGMLLWLHLEHYERRPLHGQ